MLNALRPYEKPLDHDAAAHLWRRAGFGAPRRVVEKTTQQTATEAAAAIVAGPGKDPAVDELEQILESTLGTNNADSARAWLISRMIRSDHQLREKMALFWHGHFATSIAKVRDLRWMMKQYRLFLNYGLGPFDKLLGAATRDPAMIRWLDNETNRKGHPNENFAREVFELFTLGVGNYTEKDIQEAARAFSGWHLLHGRFHFSKLQHDRGPKTVLGQTGPFGGDDILRIALEQEACGRFLARKLLQFFVHPEPADDVVAALGKEIRANNYDMSHAMRVLLASRLFYAERSRRAIIKSPLDFVVGTIRVFELRVNAQEAVPALREMGQDLLAPPNVKGWPGQRDWVNTATWLTRVNAARRLAEEVGNRGIDDLGRSLLGRPVAEQERELIERSGAKKRDAVHALLSLPEAHLA